MKKRSVILKITHLFPKKTFAKLIDFRIKFESNEKLLLKLFHVNCHILITHFFFNVSSSLKSCEILSRIEEVLHSGITFAQFTLSLFLTLCILIGIKNSLLLHSSLNSRFDASKS